MCPTAALESKKPDDKGLLKAAVAAMQANDGVAVVMDEAMQAAAEGKYDPAKVVAVKSLARVDESLIAVLAAGGASSVVLVAGPRAATDGEGAAAADADPAAADSLATEAADEAAEVDAAVDRTARLVRDTAALLLETWGSDVTVKLTTKLPRSVRLTAPADFDTGRRGFFSSMRDEARAAAAITAEHVVATSSSIPRSARPARCAPRSAPRRPSTSSATPLRPRRPASPSASTTTRAAACSAAAARTSAPRAR